MLTILQNNGSSLTMSNEATIFMAQDNQGIHDQDFKINSQVSISIKLTFKCICDFSSLGFLACQFFGSPTQLVKDWRS